MDFSTIAELRKYLTIKQNQPGKISIKFSLALMKDKKAAGLLHNRPKKPAVVLNTSVNMFSRTLTIEYLPDKCSPALLEELIATDDDQRAAEIAKELYTALYC